MTSVATSACTTPMIQGTWSAAPTGIEGLPVDLAVLPDDLGTMRSDKTGAVEPSFDYQQCSAVFDEDQKRSDEHSQEESGSNWGYVYTGAAGAALGASYITHNVLVAGLKEKRRRIREGGEGASGDAVTGSLFDRGIAATKERFAYTHDIVKGAFKWVVGKPTVQRRSTRKSSVEATPSGPPSIRDPSVGERSTGAALTEK